MLSQNQIIKLIFGLKVRDLRQKKKLTPAELANDCGLSISYLNEIEKGKKHPKADKIIAIAETLGVKYDELVSLKLSKKLEPISDLLQSQVFQEFPLEMFGLEPGKLIELIANAPVKMNAFIGTIIEIARNYEMRKESFYFAALRSFQELHDNYFEDLEDAVDDFLKEHKIRYKPPFDRKYLYDTLETEYGYTIDKEQLQANKKLLQFRSVFVPKSRKLLINDGLSESQKNFLLAREIAFNYLNLQERPNTTPPYKVRSFEEVLNNFKASYFAVALLMNKKHVINDLQALFQHTTWSTSRLHKIINKYSASPEMFLHRLSCLLPTFYGIKSLFFLRFEYSGKTKLFNLTKELHLSKLHNPHGNELNEHYCRRWISFTLIEALKRRQKKTPSTKPISGIQRSKYWETNNEYLCLTLAKPNTPSPNSHISVTIGFLVDESLKKKIHFINDKRIPVKWVNETCERCAIADCKERAAEPDVIKSKEREDQLEEQLVKLS